MMTREEFQRTWDPETFDWNNAADLARKYPQFFDIWWDPEKIRFTDEVIQALADYCGDYIEKWLPALIESSSEMALLIKTIVKNHKKIKEILEQLEEES